MYLSRIQLTEAINQDSQLGKLLQRNSYGVHSLLWDLFEQGERFLFREESSKDQLGTGHNRPLYYVLSQRAPSMESPLFEVQVKSFAPVLEQGSRLSFKLRANPTITRRSEAGKNSKRHDVVMDAQYHWLRVACKERGIAMTGKKRELKNLLLNHQDFADKTGNEKIQTALDKAIDDASRQWLSERDSKNGFEIQTLQSAAYRWNALPEKGRDAGFSSLDYEGVLTITEPELFLQCLGRGLGPSKAFGCGLMLIRRI